MSTRVVFAGIGIVIAALLSFVLIYSHYFGPVDPFAQQTDFIVNSGETTDQIGDALKSGGFIRSRTAFGIALAGGTQGRKVRPGGYKLAASMDTWSIAAALSRPPYLVFFTFPPGFRKEQIAEKLASTFSWTPEQQQHWVTTDSIPNTNFTEGVYYPDTYLIPADQTPAQIAQRFIDKFQQEYATLASGTHTNLTWQQVVILASLVEREASGPKDRSLIAGIMLNRIKDNMPLQIDATLQYIKGTPGNWWPVPTSADKSLISPFNTYAHTGLPPTAIANPGYDALEAVLNPQATDCLYYLHDTKGTIHCSKAYTGQLANVSKYLK
jgi:UPF0755 protein